MIMMMEESVIVMMEKMMIIVMNLVPESLAHASGCGSTRPSQTLTEISLVVEGVGYSERE